MNFQFTFTYYNVLRVHIFNRVTHIRYMYDNIIEISRNDKKLKAFRVKVKRLYNACYDTCVKHNAIPKVHCEPGMERLIG